MVKISDIFVIVKGNHPGIETSQSGLHPLVSASTFDCGVSTFVSNSGGGTLFAILPCITMAINGNGVMFSVVQQNDFFATTDVEILTPNEHSFWNTDRLRKLLVISAILRKACWRFSYGRKAGGRVGELDVDEQQIAVIAAGMNIATSTQTKVSLTTVQGVIAKAHHLYGPSPTVADIFDIEGGNDVKASELLDSGGIPVASASEREINSIGGYLATVPVGKKLRPARTLTVARDGKPGITRVQTGAYLICEKATILHPKHHGWSDDELAVLAALVEAQCWRFHYGRKASDKRLTELHIA